MAGVVVDTFLIFEFIKRLTTPFEKWKAFEQGVIDKDGNILKKRGQRKTTEEKDSLRLFDLTMLNLKRLLEKLPGGKSRIASYAAALFLVKENEQMHSGYYLTEDEKPTDELEKRFKEYMEDIVNTAASPGHVAGIDGDPPGPSPLGKKKKKKKLSTILARESVDIEQTSTMISLVKDGRDIATATREKVNVGKMAGGSKWKWFVYDAQKKKDIGNTLTGHSKSEAMRMMKKLAK